MYEIKTEFIKQEDSIDFIHFLNEVLEDLQKEECEIVDIKYQYSNGVYSALVIHRCVKKNI